MKHPALTPRLSPRRHAVPVFDGRVQLAGVRRINIGGKALTNHLKELVSYRYVPSPALVAAHADGLVLQSMLHALL